VAYSKANVALALTPTRVIGGTNAQNQNSGLSVINDVFPVLNIVPGILFAPGFMNNTLVTSAADALVQSVNGVFKARTIVSFDDATNARNATAAITMKGTIAATDSRMDGIWPPIGQFGPLNMPVECVNGFLQGAITQNPAQGNGIPYWSISNNVVPGMTGLALSDGTPIVVRPNDAQILNSNGIMTYVQYEEGFFTWGNRTCAYPLQNDVTLVFAVVQREMDWLANSIVLTLRPWVDNPTNQRLIESITLTAQVYLSYLVSTGALLKGIIEFLQVENPMTNLMQGKITFHYLVTPPLPAEDIENNFEFDVSGLNNLFSLVAGTATSGLASGGGLTIQ
jgi:Bacteriophage tail sheath protein